MILRITDSRRKRMNEIYHLLSYMRENNMSQRDVAEILGISEAAVSRYISFDRRPNADIQKKICAILGLETISSRDICETKKTIERLLKENLKHYTSTEKLHLIGILSDNERRTTMSNKEVKKCCVCGHYDKPKFRVFAGFICSDSCLKQRESIKEDRISSHKCEVCGKDISKCRIEEVFVSPDYHSFDDQYIFDDRYIVFLCSTTCYAYYNNMLLKETPAYAKIDKIVKQRKEDSANDIDNNGEQPT